MKKLVALLVMLILVLEVAYMGVPSQDVQAEEPVVTWVNVGREQGTQVVCSEVHPWAESDPKASIYLPSSLNDGDTGAWSGYYITEERREAEHALTISYQFSSLYKIDNVTLWPRYDNGNAVGFPEDFTISVKTKNDGWRTVVTKKGYTVEGQEGQAFLFDPVVCKEVMVSVSKMTPVGQFENGDTQYAVHMKEMEVYGYVTENLGATENIALAIKGTKASATYATAEDTMVEAGYTTDRLIDGDASEWAASFATSGNSKAEDDVVIQLDFPGWYIMDNLSLKPRLELIADEEWKVVGFPEEFDISIHTDNGWETVLEIKDYQVEILDIQSFDFSEILGNALRFHVSKGSKVVFGDLATYVVYLTEMYVYGRETQAPGFNILQSENIEISTDSTSTWAEENGYTIDKLIDNQIGFGPKGYFSEEYDTPDQNITIDVDLKDFYKIREVILYPYWTDWDQATLNNFPIDFAIEAKTIDGWITIKEVVDYQDANNGANRFVLGKEYECEKVRLVITKLAESPVNAGKYVVGLSELQVIGGDSDVARIAPEENRTLVSKDVHCVAGAAQGAETSALAANDGDSETLYIGNSYATGNVERGEYILMTLDKQARISEIVINTNKQNDKVYGFPTDFKLRVYSDGEWKNVIERTDFCTTLEEISFTFEAEEAERVELFATGLSETETAETYALQIKELSVYGTPTSTDVTADLNMDYALDDVDLDLMRASLIGTRYLVLKGADVNSDAKTDVKDLVSLLLRKKRKSVIQTQSDGTIYYVDAGVSEDGNGLSPETPLRTLEQVNQLQLKAGDTVLFKCGTAYQGCLEIQSSGEKDNPIVIGAYGEGDKPKIHGEGLVGSTVYGENVSHITVRDIEVTNDGDTTKQHRGIYFVAKSRSIYGITIENCYVHDVDSLLDTIDVGIPGLGDYHWTGGIVVRSRSEEFCSSVGNLRKISVNDVVIQHNTVKDCVQVGIIAGGSSIDTGYPSMGVSVRGNNITNCGDGVIVFGCHGAMIEGNTADENAAHVASTYYCAGIWCAESSGTLFQYNESSNMKQNDDGEGFDVDNYCTGSLLQYNYSHGNYGGAILLMQARSGSVTMRYNISQNDGHDRSFLGAFIGTEKNNHIINFGVAQDAAPYLIVNAHHNIIYTNRKYMEIIGFSGSYKKFKTDYVGTMKNNIFVATGRTPSLSGNDAEDYLSFDGNVYCGITRASTDANKKSIDPQFVSPGGAGAGILSLDAYALQATSPYTDMGFMVASK